MNAAFTIRSVVLASVLIAAPAGWACGYHSGISIARVTLNFVYPNALHVRSAVWKAQMDGLLLRDDRPAAAKALVGYGAAVKDLGRLRNGLSLVRDNDGNDPAISIVLAGPMLWARLARDGTDLDMALHASGPAAGDVVLVTDEPVSRR